MIPSIPYAAAASYLADERRDIVSRIWSGMDRDADTTSIHALDMRRVQVFLLQKNHTLHIARWYHPVLNVVRSKGAHWMTGQEWNGMGLWVAADSALMSVYFMAQSKYDRLLRFAFLLDLARAVVSYINNNRRQSVSCQWLWIWLPIMFLHRSSDRSLPATTIQHQLMV